MKHFKALLLVSSVVLLTTNANAINMAPIITYLLSDSEPQGEITINDPSLKKVIASVFDETPYTPAIDIQGVIDAGGLTVSVPYTVVIAPVTLAVYSTSVTLDALVTEDDEAGIIATFAWEEQSNLPVGSGVFTATITIDDSNAGIPDNIYNAKKLDIEDDIAGLVAASFPYTTDSIGGTGILTLKIMPGIPDRMFGQADNTGNTETHRFLYLPVTNPSTGKTWLSNNLGANYANMNSSVFDPGQQAKASDDHNAYGSLFQWGRKADGHELIYWTSRSVVEAVNDTTDVHSNNPTDALFILSEEDPYEYDWRITQDDSLWGLESGANNVCPIGYRIPTGNNIDGELQIEKESWATNDSLGAIGSPLKLPTPGKRSYSSGDIYPGYDIVYGDTEGFYWGSGVLGTEAWRLNFYNSKYGDNAVVGARERATGYSVRCIKD